MPLGIPHSQFLSWSDTDQAKALAWQRWQREKCASCGTRRGEWKKDPFAYVASGEVCPGCELVEQEHSNVPKDHRTSAYKVGLLPRHVHEQMNDES